MSFSLHAIEAFTHATGTCKKTIKSGSQKYECCFVQCFIMYIYYYKLFMVRLFTQAQQT